MQNTRGRFNIVVFNYNRLELFFNNFDKIKNYRNDVDMLTIVSGSPSKYETDLVRSFEQTHQISIKYLLRKNRGIDQSARIEFFLGDVGLQSANLNSNYIFQMQEHYLDTTSDQSRWGQNLSCQIKGDVVPDDIVFDLDEIDEIFKNQNVSTLFCDRNNPCFFTVDDQSYIAPNGGNFIFKADLLADNAIIQKLKLLKRTFSDNYGWAVFAEFFWGEIFFGKNSRSYDYKRKRLFTSFNKEDFYLSPDDYTFLRKKYIYLYKKPLRVFWHRIRNMIIVKAIAFPKI